MFPYRRGNKKRGKGNGAVRRQRDGAPNQGGGRRVPSAAHELLPLLQPTTKALAQMLAGNSKASGQLVHARNILDQAQRFIDERSVDRLIPAQREEFLEQVARLKLTLADADAMIEHEPEPQSSEVRRAAPQVSLERLRALALSLASAPEAPPPTAVDEPEAEAPPPPSPPEPRDEPVRAAREDIPQGSPRSARLRLKTETVAGPKGG